MIDRLKLFIANPWTELTGRWLLGATFIVASFHKIIHPAQFAKIIYGYQLVPDPTINLIAILLPFLELFSGVALIAGIFPRSAALIINIMLLVFIIGISVNMLRGHEFDCGCFAISNTGQTSAAGGLLVRNIIYFIIGIYLIRYTYTRKWCILNK